MKKSRCLAHSVCSTSRRDFIKKSTLITAGSVLAGNLGALALENRLPVPVPRPYGPASSYIPRINAAFVRRKENYGMWWPGAVYDGEEALKKYTYELNKAKKIWVSKLR